MSSLVSVKMPADAPRVTERKQNATVRRGWGGFSQLSASIQSAQKTSKERIELLLCVCHTVIPDRRPLRSSATFPPHIRTRWRRFIQIPRSDPNDLMWRDNDVRMTNVKRKMTTKGIASVFSWPLQKILPFYIIISNLKVKSWSKKKKEINSIIINLPFWNLFIYKSSQRITIVDIFSFTFGGLWCDWFQMSHYKRVMTTFEHFIL